jgi:predicted Kef-type K+ transport protein
MDDLLWIAPALIAGIAAARIGLPPMVGFLLCGFVLNLSGEYDHDRLTTIGNLGVTLLLFTIGLKLDLRSLLRPVIWAGTTLHGRYPGVRRHRYRHSHVDRICTEFFQHRVRGQNPGRQR